MMIFFTVPREESRLIIAMFTVTFFIVSLHISMATDQEVYRDNAEKDKIENDTDYSKQGKECIYNEDTFLLNCSNVNYKHHNVLGHVNKVIHVVDVSNALLTDMIVLSHHPKIFEQLRIVNASHNLIKQLHEETFRGLIHLEKINLSHNKLTKLADNIFADLAELKYIDISHNLLMTIPTNVPMLDWLDVSYNQIHTLPEVFSSVLYPQRVVLLGGNPFNCDCKTTWLKEWFNTRLYLLKYVSYIDTDKFIPTCFLPEKLKGEQWDVLHESQFECENNEDETKTEASYNHEMVIKVTVEEISYHSMLVRWNDITKQSTNSIEIRYHKFGKSKDRRKIVIPLTAGSFRLKGLKDDTPYIICFSVSSEATITPECEEIVTLKLPQKAKSSIVLIEEIFVYISDNIIQILVLFIIVLVLLSVLSHVLFENDVNKEKDD